MLEKILNSRLAQWVDERSGLVRFIRSHLTDYPTPRNLNYMWAFGSIAMTVLLLQVLTGIFLAMFYKASAVPTGGGYTMAFDSVERIMREVHFGWLIRYMHAVGASAFFFVIYLHMARGIYYGSYKRPRELLWLSGVAIFLLMQSTVFFGYLLPWGQTSYWAVTVITNLFGATPIIGEWLMHWIRGAYAVGDPTLTRFFALHYLFPFLLLALMGAHVLLLHAVHSNNPTGEGFDERTAIPFHPYYTVKDLFGIGIFAIVFAWFVFYNPTGWGLFIEPENFEPANPLKTPPHIKPVWYLTPWYEILRMVPSKLGGVIALNLAFFLLFALPWLDRSPVRAASRRPLVIRAMIWAFFGSIIVLGYCGSQPPTPALTLLARLAGAVYFGFFLLLPFVTRREAREVRS